MDACSMVIWWMLLCVRTQGLDWRNHGFLHPVPIADEESSNSACREDSRLLVAALENRTLWAEQMWDASAKTPVGLLTGTNVQLGDFDECLGVDSPIHSRYCLVSFGLDVPPGHDSIDPEALTYPPNISAWDKIHYGGSRAKQRLDKMKMALCVPRTCQPSDVEAWVSSYLGRSSQTGMTVHVEEGACAVAGDPEYSFTLGDIAFCSVMLAAFLAVASATIYDLRCYNYDGSPPANCLQCLSAYRALRSLFKEQGVAGLNLNSLYGIHVFAFFFIVLGHRFGYFMCTTIINYDDVEYMFRNPWLAMWTGHMDLFCDMFFYLSAFLLGVIFSVELEKGYISPLKVYAHRLVRLLPAYATMVFFYATVYYKIGSGPGWNSVIKREQDQCKEFWWVNLLFLNNYLGGDKMCLLQSWYIACDFQLFLAGTLLVLLLNRRPRLGFSLSGLLLMASVLAPFLGTYWYRHAPLLTFYKHMWEDVRHDDLYVSVYSQAHYRGAGYLVGLLAGYGVYKMRAIQLNKTQTWCTLIVGLSIGLLTYFSGALYTDTAGSYQPVGSALYAATNHLVFAVGLTLILVSLIQGSQTFVTDLAGWRGFVPLSKLSYSMYLVHNMPQIAAAAALRNAVKFDLYGLVSGTVSDVVLGLALSLILYLFIESPFRYLFKHMTTRRVETHSEEYSEDAKDGGSDWSRRLATP